MGSSSLDGRGDEAAACLVDAGELAGGFDQADHRWSTEVDEVGQVAVRGGRGRRTEHPMPGVGCLVETKSCLPVVALCRGDERLHEGDSGYQGPRLVRSTHRLEHRGTQL